MEELLQLLEIAKTIDLKKVENDYYKGALKESDFLRLMMLSEQAVAQLKPISKMLKEETTP